MNFALMLKTARDHAALFLLTVGAVLLFEILFVLAMRSLAPELIAFISRRMFLQNMFRALLSLDMQAGISVNTLLVLGLVHPFLFAVTWGFLTTICTRVTVGEIDQGTADLLLTLPLSRSTIYVSTLARLDRGGRLLERRGLAGPLAGKSRLPAPHDRSTSPGWGLVP